MRGVKKLDASKLVFIVEKRQYSNAYCRFAAAERAMLCRQFQGGVRLAGGRMTVSDFPIRRVLPR
jgi:hypothetical protein